MGEFEDIVLSCAKWQDLPRAYAEINVALPADIKKRMTDIMVNYLARFGPQGVFDRFNNRTISQILAEYDPGQIQPVKSGVVDGVRYALYKRATPGQKESSGE
jgi:hypothetical protein